MKQQNEPTLADELVGLSQILIESGEEGLTIDEIQALTGWDNKKTHLNLLELSRQVESYKHRAKGQPAVTKYRSKVR